MKLGCNARTFKYIGRDLLAYWRTLVVILTPLIFLPLPLVYPTRAIKCAYTVILMAVFWTTEVMPLGITAFLPVFMFPLTGVLGAGDTCMQYLNATNWLFIGGAIVALAVENCNLHKRLALKILLFMGSEPHWLMLGFMITSAFLSMWLSNTATTAMMIPIALAVIEELLRYSNLQRKRQRLAGIEGGLHDGKVNPKVIGLPDYPDFKRIGAPYDNRLSSTDVSTFDSQNHLPYVAPYKRIGAPYDNYSSTTPTPITSIEISDMETTFSASNPSLTNMGQVNAAYVSDEKVDTTPPDPTKGDYLHEDTVFTDIEVFETLPIDDQKLAKAIMLSICYAASIGGTGTPTGTGPNIVAFGMIENYATKRNATTDLSYATWMAFQIPALVLNLFICWMWLLFVFMGFKYFKKIFRCCRKNDEGPSEIHMILQRNYEELGKMSFAEWSSLFFFMVLVILWFFRDPKFIPGWASYFTKGYIKTAVPGVLISCILFVWPRECPDFLCFSGRDPTKKPKIRKALMTWKIMHEKFYWSVMMILGGGFAMAEGVEASGLSRLIGDYMEDKMGHIHPAVIVCAVVFVITFLTEFSSNVSTATIFVPIMLSLSAALNQHPLYFSLPMTIACSFAFMLPVATPPNAIVYGSNMLHVKDMATTGFALNLISILVVCANAHTIMWWIFKFGSPPAWNIPLAGEMVKGDH